MLAAGRIQSGCSDRVEKPRCRAVIKDLWWFQWWEMKIDFNRMPLAGSDLTAVVTQRESLLVVLSDNTFQQLASQWLALVVGKPNEFIDVGPTLLVQCEANGLGLMPQHQAEELADSNKFG